jgi:hypothetical protein
MKWHEDTGGAVVVTYDSRSLSILLLAIAFMGVGMAGYDSVIGSHDTNRLAAQLTGSGIFVLCALVFLEKTYFRFDPVEKLITWNRRRGFQQREGVVAFGDVRSVAVEVPIGDDGVPSRRICLHLADRTLLPLVNAYHVDADDGIVRLADRLRMVLGQSVSSSLMESARALVDEG